MLGPVQVLVVATEDDAAASAVLASAGELGPDGPVRCLDAFAVAVGEDGQVEVDADRHPSVALFAGAPAGGDAAIDDTTWSVTDGLEPGGRGVVLLLEHRWAVGLVGDLRAAGATLAHEAWLHDDDRAALEGMLEG